MKERRLHVVKRALVLLTASTIVPLIYLQERHVNFPIHAMSEAQASHCGPNDSGQLT